MFRMFKFLCNFGIVFHFCIKMKLTNWIKTPVVKRAVVYGCDFENTQSEVNLLNYNNLHKLLHA